MPIRLPIFFAILFVWAAFFVLNPNYAYAGSLSNARDIVSDPRAGQSSTHTFQFSVSSSAVVQEIRFQFSTLPSNSSKPNGLDLTSAALGTLVNMDGDWTLNTTNAPSGQLLLQHTDGGQDLGGAFVTIPIQAISNSSIGDCGTETSSDSCFVQIQTATVPGVWDTSVVDETTLMYTVIQEITVSATVDPTFTFIISSVGSNTVIGGVTTTVASTVTTLPFGNLTAGIAKYSAHRLNVTTNSNSGYTVTMRMVSQMTGSYSNNIDPYAGDGAS